MVTIWALFAPEISWARPLVGIDTASAQLKIRRGFSMFKAVIPKSP